MTEHEDTAQHGPTGHAQVDAVLRTLDSLSDVPVDQHVAVFEGAHAELRAALTDAAVAGTGPAPHHHG